jgi:hypothetical protein
VLMPHDPGTVLVKSQSLWRGRHCTRVHVMHIKQNMAKKPMVHLLSTSSRLRAAMRSVRAYIVRNL